LSVNSIDGVPSVTALKYRGGLQLGVGTSTGHVSTCTQSIVHLLFLHYKNTVLFRNIDQTRENSLRVPC